MEGNDAIGEGDKVAVAGSEWVVVDLVGGTVTRYKDDQEDGWAATSEGVQR
jgi:hypothetical protein